VVDGTRIGPGCSWKQREIDASSIGSPHDYLDTRNTRRIDGADDVPTIVDAQRSGVRLKGREHAVVPLETIVGRRESDNDAGVADVVRSAEDTKIHDHRSTPECGFGARRAPNAA